jgi:hypothetical protein
MTDGPKATVTLTFEDIETFRWVDDPIHQDLSAAARSGDSLFLSCDETAGIERLTPEGDGWGNHAHYALGDLVALPGGPDGEMDIEGMDVDDGWLWIAGSHSLKRGKPKGGPTKGMKRMRRIGSDPNRFFLGRIPLVERDGGLAPVGRDGGRALEHVGFGKRGGGLRRWLRKDPLLAPFMDLPCKENGFDVEGLAVQGARVWLGLRGPVLRGHAAIVEMEMKSRKGLLKARRTDGRRRYRLHLLPTQGQGVRDLKAVGGDLLLLTGPATAGDGAAEVLRWKGGAKARKAGVVPDDDVERLVDLPYRGAVDHPEGMARWGDDWLVVYDSPAKERLAEKPARVTADVWSF